MKKNFTVEVMFITSSKVIRRVVNGLKEQDEKEKNESEYMDSQVDEYSNP